MHHHEHDHSHCGHAHLDDIAKLKVLMPHLIEHGDEHTKTYAEWAARLEKAGRSEDAAYFRDAAELCGKAMDLLRRVII